VSLLLILVIILVIFAIFGGLAISPLLWLLVLVALIVFLFDRRGSRL